jgi:dTDP-glucose 4,6-dehydratase
MVEQADLDHVLDHTRGLWDELRGERLFITGGTGFIGSWLLDTFAYANERLCLNASALVLTRGQHADRPGIAFHVGDVRTFDFPVGAFPLIIHGATDVSTNVFARDPLTIFDVIVEGTRRVLNFAGGAGTKKLLFLSSGAAYGNQPNDMIQVPEEYEGAPDTTDASFAYGAAKRAGEQLCSIFAERSRLQVKLARCYAFIGPYMKLNSHFAAGNFIRDGLAGGPIQVYAQPTYTDGQDDRTPYRTYLYAADLAIWLWTILFRGESCRLYNVGSDEPQVTIAELVYKIAKAFHPAVPVEFSKEPKRGPTTKRYVPSTRRAREELGLEQKIDLEDAIKRTIRWNGGHDDS